MTEQQIKLMLHFLMEDSTHTVEIWEGMGKTNPKPVEPKLSFLNRIMDRINDYKQQRKLIKETYTILYNYEH